jgi:flagellar biogenesis protein FliO
MKGEGIPLRTWISTYIRIGFFLLIILSCIVAPLVLYAQSTTEPEVSDQALQETQEQEPLPDYEYTEPEFEENMLSYPMLVLRTIAVLAVIVVGLYVLFRVLVKKRNRIVTDTDIIKVHATFPLAANKLIQVVEIAEKILVLGVSDSNINLIAEVEDKETIDKIKVMSSKEKKGPLSFKDQFFKLLGGRAFPKSEQISYFNNYKKRIDKMKKL